MENEAFRFISINDVCSTRKEKAEPSIKPFCSHGKDDSSMFINTQCVIPLTLSSKSEKGDTSISRVITSLPNGAQDDHVKKQDDDDEYDGDCSHFTH